MSSNHTYGNQYGAECPYCGKLTHYEINEQLHYYPDIECEHCENDIEVVAVDITIDVVLGRKSASEEEDGID
jgi:DNA-directed RNA polymerase subunit RPC12/RpoP